jgi:hypothetical protein
MASPRVDELFHSEHTIDRSALERLRPEDFRELRETVRGRIEEPHRVRAMRVLVDATGLEAMKPLAEVVGNRDEDPVVRAVAASQLGRLGRMAQDSLAEALDPSQPTVAIAAAGALAKAGTPDVVPRLDELARAAEQGALARQARFAATVISFRSREPGHEPPPPSEDEILSVPEGERLPIVMRPARRSERENALRDLERDTYGIALAPQLAFVTCAPERMLVCLDGERLGSDVGHAFDAPLLAGLIARRDPVQRRFSPRWLILSWPWEVGTVAVAVHRPSGERFMSGEGRLEGRSGHFELRAVRGRGNEPVELTGTMEDGRLTSLAGTAASSRPERAEPAPDSG